MNIANLNRLRGAASNVLAIIGTAGRKDDAARLSLASYDRMCATARAVITKAGYTALVSGGAAWGDHVAVSMVLDGVLDASQLTLYVPAPLAQRGFDETSRDGGVCNYYHRTFATVCKRDPTAELNEVRARRARLIVNHAGFKARNSDVARTGSDGMLAFTFGSGEPWRATVWGDVTATTARLKDGGTQDT